ncbi:MAG: aldo/keto reductase [Geminicoccaceae bacterium]|nr:aldo/keto reductase [Geminicoccaceae bacterium]
MDYTSLGRTGLRVSVAGLGCGGSSRIGMAHGRSSAEAAKIVRQCLDLGVNFFDTAMQYGTEEAVGLGIEGVPRDEVVISTKSQIARDGRRFPPAEVLANLDDSLRRLRLDHVDVFHLHGVRPEDYDHALEVREALLKARDAGKTRFLGITETGPHDPGHTMLRRALDDDGFDVVMTAFHMMNQNTREIVFPRTMERGIGTLIMFAVRSIFSEPDFLRTTMRALAEEGKVPAELARKDEPLDFLVHPSGAESVVDAAYRYARHEPGVDVVLFGTGNPAHVESNVRSILRPPLPEADRRKLRELFSHLENVGLTLPKNRS